MSAATGTPSTSTAPATAKPKFGDVVDGNLVWIGGPPAAKDGEPHTKEIDGKKLMWCSKCRQGKGHWNSTHLTKEHVVGFKKQKAEASGNVHQVDLSKIQGSVSEAEMAKLREWLQL